MAFIKSIEHSGIRMNILTYFDQNKILDGWRNLVEQEFSLLKANFIHTDTLDDAIHHMGIDDSDIVMFGFSDGKNGAWTKLVPYVRKNQIPVLITGDLDKHYYCKTFRERTGQTLQTLDAVNFRRDAEILANQIRERNTHSTGEYKE